MHFPSKAISDFRIKVVPQVKVLMRFFGGYLYFRNPLLKSFKRNNRKSAKNYLQLIYSVDKSTMAQGLETRVLFLDTDFLGCSYDD
jgi:asparagine synthetase B (glutamine-hydrolysing)